MEKVVQIGGKTIKLKASALTPRLYRHLTGRDMMRDVIKIKETYDRALKESGVRAPGKSPAGDDAPEERQAYQKKLNEWRAAKVSAEMEALDTEVLENMAYVMARQADPSIPSTVEEWLDTLDITMSMYHILPDVMRLWVANEKTSSIPKKKSGQRHGK